DLARGEATDMLPGDRYDSDDDVSPHHRHRHVRTDAASPGVLTVPRAPRHIVINVDDVLYGARERRPAFGTFICRDVGDLEVRHDSVGAAWQSAPCRRHTDKLALVAEHCGRPGPEQPHDAVGNGLEDRFHVHWRVADHPQDLARRGLLLQGCGQVTVTRLQLLEQAHILDSDHSLRGEGLQEGDL